MRSLFRGHTRANRAPTQHRLIRQAASLLLSYPDEQLANRLAVVQELLDHTNGEPRRLLENTLDALRATDLLALQTDYVDTFDLRRGATMYLTYWTDGDTRSRGSAMHAFLQTYRDAGVRALGREAPDHLTVVLEFAALGDPDAGERLLTEHRIPLEVLRGALTERKSLYAPAVDAVCATLPPVTDQEERRAHRLAAAGPPAEAIGLQPFTLTVPPRRTSPEPTRHGGAG
ncbi:nitrate reductase molybdenum cofactor assembly chaperone [Nocardia cyriacigeorgica]|uniref:Nitrate reductase molybdenum cofactor assembly chaperone n=1 Tax=Nocardia cyriacigeorgica (strain GUH-2) TaxID=1127134 RepID=H6RAA1_NOCCG|nr:nitrate reductase molybdenum cofactor assembly chaperone [Nocardia cyriacigeorgica]BDT87350.1 nitrate reductase molybdenum cofactor assembly chaperone [Nocardia cyriacigeorgica]CCF63709.1 Nitrate reductase molybdenum cofactor assembly chaperone [Nocardia cyriacigeorgica GUH-2]